MTTTHKTEQEVSHPALFSFDLERLMAKNVIGPSGMSDAERKQFYTSRFEDQRHLLRTAIKGMHEGDLTQALTIATVIRVLVHETGSSRPLLKQLCTDFVALEIPHSWPSGADPNKPMLVYLPTPVKIEAVAAATSSTGRVCLGELPQNRSRRITTIDLWWDGPFGVLPGVGEFCRRDVILGLANKEGAHVDSKMPAKYVSLLKSQFLRANINNVEVGALNLARLLAGLCGMQMLACLDQHFPVSLVP